jgi:nucleotide-binding universal stress UspA family protein
MLRDGIVVGLDASFEAAAAAGFGTRLAEAAGGPCHLVHAVHDVWSAAVLNELPGQVDVFNRALELQARGLLMQAHAGNLPAALLDTLTVRTGRAAEVLNDVALERHAAVVVLGGKHHSALGRWLGGSTSINVARTAAVPTLVTAGAAPTVRRVLVALDISAAARITFEAAREYANLFGAELQILSVFEPLPTIGELAPPIDSTAYYDLCRRTLEQELAGIPLPAPITVRHGMTIDTLLREAAQSRADLLVVGSHGKSWKQRLLLGTVTERLLNHLPTSLLVVPTSGRRAASPVPAESLVTAAT